MSSIGKRFISSNYGQTFTDSGSMGDLPTNLGASSVTYNYPVFDAYTTVRATIIADRSMASVGARGFAIERQGAAQTFIGETCSISGGNIIVDFINIPFLRFPDTITLNTPEDYITGSGFALSTFSLCSQQNIEVAKAIVVFVANTSLQITIVCSAVVESGPLVASEFTAYDGGADTFGVPDSISIVAGNIFVDWNSAPANGPDQLVYIRGGTGYVADNNTTLASFDRVVSYV